jgi:hypothetical protein
VVALASLTAVGIARRWVRAHPRPGVRV